MRFTFRPRCPSSTRARRGLLVVRHPGSAPTHLLPRQVGLSVAEVRDPRWPPRWVVHSGPSSADRYRPVSVLGPVSKSQHQSRLRGRADRGRVPEQASQNVRAQPSTAPPMCLMVHFDQGALANPNPLPSAPNSARQTRGRPISSEQARSRKRERVAGAHEFVGAGVVGRAGVTRRCARAEVEWPGARWDYTSASGP